MATFSQIFSNFNKKAATQSKVVGIDVGSSSIKVVEVEDRKGVLTLTTYGELQLGPYAEGEIGQSVTLDAKKEQQALVDVIRESAVKATQAVFAMPMASSFVTTMNFLVTDSEKEDIGSRVRVEARKYIPVPIGEVTLDWAEIESLDKSDEKRRDVLVAAIQNEALNRFKILMQFVNLPEPPTEIECFSALRGVHVSGEDGVAVIDIGAVSTKLYIARQGLLQRIHRVRAGGVIATKRIASALDISFEDAELRKRNASNEDAAFQDIKRAHHSVYERSWQEFRQVIRDYEAQSGHTIKNIYLTGGGSLFPTAVLQIQEVIQKDVVHVNAFEKVAYPAFMEDMMAEIAPTFHVALGAALRSFE